MAYEVRGPYTLDIELGDEIPVELLLIYDFNKSYTVGKDTYLVLEGEHGAMLISPKYKRYYSIEEEEYKPGLYVESGGYFGEKLELRHHKHKIFPFVVKRNLNRMCKFRSEFNRIIKVFRVSYLIPSIIAGIIVAPILVLILAGFCVYGLYLMLRRLANGK